MKKYIKSATQPMNEEQVIDDIICNLFNVMDQAGMDLDDAVKHAKRYYNDMIDLASEDIESGEARAEDYLMF